MDEDDYQMFKIVVIGNTATGKTNIAARFVKGEFAQNSKATVGVQFLAKILTIRNTKVKITFWDTAGQERYKSLSKVYYKGAAGIIIVYDITEPQTYLDVQSWLRLASNSNLNSDENLNINEVKIIIIGNKTDLQEQRKITYDRVKAQYKEKFDIDCFQTSAKTGEGIQQSIMFLIQKIYDINARGRGSQMPFEQDDDDDVQEENNQYIDSVVYQKSNQKSKFEQQNKTKKNKGEQVVVTVNKQIPKQKKVAANESGKTEQKKDNKKQDKKGTKLQNNTKKKEKKKGGCC